MSTPQDPFRPPAEGEDRGASAGGTPPAWTPPPGWGAPGEQPVPPADQPPGWGSQPGGPPTWGTAGQQPAWGGGPSGRPPFGTAPQGSPRNGAGTLALVLGLLSLPAAITIVGGALLGLIAVVLGVQGRKRARRGEATNGGAATAGIVLGVLGLAATAAIIAAGVSILQSDTGRDLVDCLEQAPDQAAVEQCQREAEDSLLG